MNGLSAFIKRHERDDLSLHHMRTQQEGGHLQARKRGLTRTRPGKCPNLFQPLELGEINVCCLSCLVRGILLQQPGLACN